MKMTQEQAIRFCREQARAQSTSEEESLWWISLAEQIQERDLDCLETVLRARATRTGWNVDMNWISTFLDALTDEDQVAVQIASELREKYHIERETLSPHVYALRRAYYEHLIRLLGEVESLADLERVAEDAYQGTFVRLSELRGEVEEIHQQAIARQEEEG